MWKLIAPKLFLAKLSDYFIYSALQEVVYSTLLLAMENCESTRLWWKSHSPNEWGRVITYSWNSSILNLTVYTTYIWDFTRICLSNSLLICYKLQLILISMKGDSTFILKYTFVIRQYQRSSNAPYFITSVNNVGGFLFGKISKYKNILSVSFIVIVISRV